MWAGAAFGAGEYQRTKDGKTLIWNANPKPDDTASWWGERDKDGYATGVGELTWYTGKGAVYARYYGNMVHGKFDGPVNVHVKGTTAHAFFSDGKRMTGWARGAASSRFAIDWRSALAREKAEAAPATSPPPTTEPVSASEELRRNAQQTQQSPAEGPTEQPATKKEDKAKFAPVNLPPRGEESPRKSEENVQRPTPNPPPQSYGGAGPPPQSSSEAGAEQPKNKMAQGESERAEKAEQQPVREASEPPRLSSIPHYPTNTAAAATAQDHGSLAELTMPPSALRNEPTVETPSTAPEADLASSPSASAHLTTDEAVEIADTEARARGYDLAEYQRPKADYSKVKGKWSLVYDLKNPNVTQEMPHRLRVTVDDASRKAEVSP